MEIKKKRIAAKRMGLSSFSKIHKTLTPIFLFCFVLFFPKLYSYYPLCDFHQKPLLPSKDVSFIHMRGWSHKWDLDWTQVTVQTSSEFPSSIFQLLLPDLYYLESRSENKFHLNIYFVYFFSLLEEKSFAEENKLCV